MDPAAFQLPAVEVHAKAQPRAGAGAFAAEAEEELDRATSPPPATRDIAVQRLIPDVEVPPAPVVDMPPQPDAAAADTSQEMQGASAGVQVSGSASGGGGVTAFLMEQATSAFRSLVGSVTGDARSVGTAAGTAVGSTAGGIFGGLSGLASELGSALGTGFSGLLSGHGSMVKGLIRAAKGTLRSVLHKAAGALGGLQGAIKSTVLRILQAGSGNPLQAVQAMVRQAIDKVIGGIATAVSDKVAAVAGSVTAVLGRVEALVAAIGPRLQAFVAQASRTVSAAITRVQGMVAGFLSSASSLAAALPGPVRRLVQSLLTRLRAAADRFAERVRAAAASAASRISAVVQRISTAVLAAAARAKAVLADLVKTVAKNAERVLRMAIDIALRVAAGVRKVTDKIVDAALSAILPTLPKFLFDWAVEKLTPLLVQRIMDAAGIDLSTIGRPKDPGQIAAAATELAQQTAAKAPASISAGLLDPDGDHVAKGIYASGAWQFKPPFTVNGTIQLTLDFVANYRTNKIAFFVTPGWAAGGGVATGKGGVGGDVGVTDAWGTVATFGQDASGKPLDIDNFSGRFFNVGASAGVSVPVRGVPVVVTTGGGIYTSGATGPTTTPGSTTPGTSTPGTSTPGTSTPGTTTPGTTTPPVTTPAHPLGTFSVPFANQSAVPTTTAGIDQAVDAVRGDVSAHPGGRYSVDVVGRASNRWAAAGDDGERRENNKSLSEQRASGVAGETGRRMAGLPVSGPPSHRGVGVEGARGDVRTNDPADRRADITPSVGPVTTPGSTTPGTTTPGTTTPGTTTPGTTTPGTTTPGTTTPGTGATLGNPTGPWGVWGPQTSGGKPLVGWDSTRTIGVGTSKEPSAGASVTVGNSYSVMLGSPITLPQWAMHCVRAVVGLYKLTMDVQSASPLGFLRDATALFAPLLNAKTDAIADMIVDAVIPIPDEELA